MSKKNLILGVMALIACIGAYLLAGSPDEDKLAAGKTDPRILSANTIAAPDEPPSEQDRAGRFAYWQTLTNNAIPIERRKVADEDNGYPESKELARLYREFAEQYSKDEREAVWKMALGHSPWIQEIADAMLNDGAAVLEQFQRLLEKPDLQFPSLDEEPYDDVLLGDLFSFLKHLKQVKIENLRRNGDTAGAVDSALGYLEFTNRLRNADGLIMHELIGLAESRRAKAALKQSLDSNDPMQLEAIAIQLAGMSSPSELSTIALWNELRAIHYAMGAAISGKPIPNLAPDAIEAPDGSKWGNSEIQEAYDRADLGHLANILDLQWKRFMEFSESSEEFVHRSEFSGNENSSLDSMTPRQLSEFLAELSIPYVKHLGNSSNDHFLEHHLMQTWIATERARLDGIELSSPELLVPQYLEAIPENPFTGDPLGFDGTFFGENSAGEVQRFE